MSSPNEHVNAVFTAFVEAQKAMDRLPELEAKLAVAEQTAQHLNTAVDHHKATIDDREATIEALNTKVASLEAALAQATFREKEVRDQRQVLLDAVRGIVKEVTETTALVDPPPLPVETTASPPTEDSVPLDPTPHSTSGPSGGSVAVSVQSDPAIPTGGPTGPASITGDGWPSYDSGSVGQSASDPTGPGSVATTGEPISPSTAEATRNSDGPFASSTAGQSTSAVSAEATPAEASSTQQSASSADTRVIASPPKDYWLKPSSMTWRQWQSYGNLIPHWIDPASDGMDWH
jgi:uncharacterized coiled-coil protein SlyX